MRVIFLSLYTKGTSGEERKEGTRECCDDRSELGIWSHPVSLHGCVAGTGQSIALGKDIWSLTAVP